MICMFAITFCGHALSIWKHHSCHITCLYSIACKFEYSGIVVMPPKKNQGSAARGSCCVCCQAVASKDEALFCTGTCQKWLHRYCASVSVQQYKTIADNNSPFLCPCCCRERQQEDISELRSTVEAMKLEIAQLKESLTSLSTAQVDAGTGSSYANRVAAGAARAGSHRPRRRQEGKGRGNVTPSSLEPSSGPQINPGMDTERSSATSPKGKNKVRVVGARRIWGTLKNSTSSIVKSVILRLCKVDGEIRVRRRQRRHSV